jgi:hypothetical protein
MLEPLNGKNEERSGDDAWIKKQWTIIKGEGETSDVLQ